MVHYLGIGGGGTRGESRRVEVETRTRVASGHTAAGHYRKQGGTAPPISWGTQPQSTDRVRHTTKQSK